MKTTIRLAIALMVCAVGLGSAAAASAAPKDGPSKSGEHHGRGARHFEAADKNKDGFLTKDEVGEARWARIRVADANGDGKVSKAELERARAEGKLGHHKHAPKS
jgi:hypothetical protein